MHAIAAGEIDDAAELIAAHWQRAWHVDPRTVARWLDALPAGAIEADPRLCLVARLDRDVHWAASRTSSR